MRMLIPVSLVLSIVVWMVLSWPLPLHMTKAIPLSAHVSSDEKILYMTPGDSLQLLHYFELVHEWITGGTPWFYNLYEFNTGDDAERYSPSGYYVPFSLIYSAVRSFTTQALGMNIAGIVSLWATLLATWLLLRRYTKDEWVVALFSIFVLLFPYRWKALFDGSPTGYAMMWVPIMILGLDIAVRDGKLRGGVIAGLAVIFAYLVDTHVFFFSVLLAPAWCLLALLPESGIVEKGWQRYVRIARALAPTALAAIVVVVAVQGLARTLHETAMGQGRALSEVIVFSPQASGFFAWQHSHISSQAYVGWSIAILIGLGLLAMTWFFLRRPRGQFRTIIFFSLLCLGILTVAVLALGPHGLRSGGLFLLARELIPPYAMIRQVAKIFSIMPTLLAVAGVLALTALIKAGTAKAWWRGLCVAVAAVALFWEYTALSTPDLIYLQEEQPAYQAVAEDARSRGEDPHVLVVTLWLGDSHYAAIYQHFALQYRIRMLNGYTPAVSKTYFGDVFLPFQSINQGYLSEEQIAKLRSMGIGHILVHEDLYPEKVAPFPVTYAIKHFLEHPRLKFLERSESVWAFRILEEPMDIDPRGYERITRQWTMFFPARHWEMEQSMHDALVMDDASASGMRYVALATDGAFVDLAETGAPPAPALRWMIRSRGQGKISAEILSDGKRIGEALLVVDHRDWHWLKVPVEIEEFSELSLRLRRVEGSVDLDSALMPAGDWTFLEPGESMIIPAPSLFHAGYTDIDMNRLVFYERLYGKRVIFYGPKMPMEPGRYDMNFVYQAQAEPGVELGVMHVERGLHSGNELTIPLYQGQALRFELDLSDNLPLNMYFVFSGKADMMLDKVEITRIK